MRMHHIGIIVKSIKNEQRLYESLGYTTEGDIIFDDIQSNNLMFMRNRDSDELIELIEPVSDKSTVKSLGKGYAHICYETDNLDEYIKKFKKEKTGVIFSDKITAIALGNRQIIFAYLKNGTIVEFVEI